jgi:hypothetical protein
MAPKGSVGGHGLPPTTRPRPIGRYEAPLRSGRCRRGGVVPPATFIEEAASIAASRGSDPWLRAAHVVHRSAYPTSTQYPWLLLVTIGLHAQFPVAQSATVVHCLKQTPSVAPLLTRQLAFGPHSAAALHVDSQRRTPSPTSAHSAFSEGSAQSAAELQGSSTRALATWSSSGTLSTTQAVNRRGAQLAARKRKTPRRPSRRSVVQAAWRRTGDEDVALRTMRWAWDNEWTIMMLVLRVCEVSTKESLRAGREPTMFS